MTIFDRVLSQPEFKDRPPVLVDIGASGEIHAEWRSVAAHSICVAFEADDREFGFVENETSGFRQLHICNCIVSDREDNEVDFYLTKSPFCSSILPPDNRALAQWRFWELFEVERKKKLTNRSLASILKDLGLSYVDWFKTDSQGIDLRLFQSLGPAIDRVITADFEPGLIDAYNGEDKLWSILAFMEKHPFWICDFDLKGTQRLSKELTVRYADRLRFLALKTTPGWGEISFLNLLHREAGWDRRDVLLAWVIACVKNQYGFALELIERFEAVIEPSLGGQMREYTMQKLFFSNTGRIIDRIKRRLIAFLERL